MAAVAVAVTTLSVEGTALPTILPFMPLTSLLESQPTFKRHMHAAYNQPPEVLAGPGWTITRGGCRELDCREMDLYL
jgi:hypothetical protein